MLTVITPAASHALTTLDAIKTELRGDAGTADDGWLGDAIDRASATVRRFCNRPFALETVREAIRPAASLESLSLERWPVVSIVSITEGGRTLATTDYETDDDAGFVHRLTGADQRRPWPATKIVVEYQAGYVLPGDPARTLPEDIERAVIGLVVRLWCRRGTSDPVRSATYSDGSNVTYSVNDALNVDGLPSEVAGLLAPYRLPSFG